MKKLILLLLLCTPVLLLAQEQPTAPGTSGINRESMTLRPNSRDYNIVRKGNNHQRLIQLRSQAMMRNKQALMNRKMAMEQRRIYIQKQMFRQQKMHQRMIRQRGRHR